MQRSLTISSPGVNQTGIGRDYLSEFLNPPQTRCGMNLHDRTALNRIHCQFGCRAVEESEATGPPAALCVDVGTSFEQYIKHLAAANSGNDRCVESSDRIVDPCLHF